MNKVKLSNDFKRKIEDECKKTAKNLAKECADKLTKKYISLIDWYYQDRPEGTYKRTYGLYDSGHRYYVASNNSLYFYGGVQIDASKMHDYINLKGETFTAERLLDKYIYVATQPSATWHGGNWYGGYGVKASFSLYNEIYKYRDKLVKELEERTNI